MKYAELFYFFNVETIFEVLLSPVASVKTRLYKNM